MNQQPHQSTLHVDSADRIKQQEALNLDGVLFIRQDKMLTLMEHHGANISAANQDIIKGLQNEVASLKKQIDLLKK